MRPGGKSTTSKTTKKRATAKRRASRSMLLRRWLAVGALVLVGLLYYRPLIAYKGAHGELAQKRAVVAKLQQEKARLQHRLGASTSIETLAREARSLGYVKPNERLFIVKGINAWRKRERANLARP